MKQVTVRYFAIFREAAGRDQETLETTAQSARELFAELTHRNEALAGYEAALVAINDEMAQWDSAVQDGDVVLFFPPVAGG